MDTSRDSLIMNSHASKPAMSAQEEDLMQLTLQLRNKKENDKNAKFHGDNLIAVSAHPCASNPTTDNPARIQSYPRSAG